MVRSAFTYVMFRIRGENLRAIYVLLFLHIAFFLLEYQSAERFAAMFRFENDAFLAGQVWRLVTFQFTTSGQGWLAFPPLVLFVQLVLLYLMGSAVEEEWGTSPFLIFFFISSAGSAAVASWLGMPILGSYFVNFTLLFVYASVFPQQTFYFFGVLPLRIQWIAFGAAALLTYGAFAGGLSNVAALGGAIAGYLYFLLHRVPAPPAEAAEPERSSGADATAIRNAARAAAIRKALVNATATDVDRLIGQSERDVVRGVNICPPADFKPQHSDGYCIRCEGFSECAVRFLKMNRPAPVPPVEATPAIEA